MFEEIRTLKQASNLLKEVYIRKATDDKLEISLQDAVIRNSLMISVVVKSLLTQTTQSTKLIEHRPSKS